MFDEAFELVALFDESSLMRENATGRFAFQEFDSNGCETGRWSQDFNSADEAVEARNRGDIQWK